jgi:hypothetical protein
VLFADYHFGLIWHLISDLFRSLQVHIHKWRSWPIVQGRVCSTSPSPHRTMLGSGWTVELSYFYSIGGEAYSGWFRCNLWDKESAEALLNQYTRDVDIRVRYNLARPEESVVLLEDIQVS